LSKGQQVSPTKAGGGNLSQVRMGIGWDATRKRGLFRGDCAAQRTGRLIDESTESEIARYDLSGSGSHKAKVMAKVARDGAGWSMTALGSAASGRTFHDLLPAIAAFV
jgi:stress response protein SCP2